MLQGIIEGDLNPSEIQEQATSSCFFCDTDRTGILKLRRAIELKPTDTNDLDDAHLSTHRHRIRRPWGSRTIVLARCAVCSAQHNASRKVNRCCILIGIVVGLLLSPMIQHSILPGQNLTDTLGQTVICMILLGGLLGVTAGSLLGRLMRIGSRIDTSSVVRANHPDVVALTQAGWQVERYGFPYLPDPFIENREAEIYCLFHTGKRMKHMLEWLSKSRDRMGPVVPGRK